MFELDTEEKFRNTIPADGWYALYFDPKGSAESGKPVLYEEPLVCWVITTSEDASGIPFVWADGLVVSSEDGLSDRASSGCGSLPLEPLSPDSQQLKTVVFMGYVRGEKGLQQAIDRATVEMTEQMKAAKWIQ